jgi:hypothetical protein
LRISPAPACGSGISPMIPRPRRCASPNLGHHAPAAGVCPRTHARDGISGGPETALARREGGSFRPRRPAPAPDRLPAEERPSGPEVEDPIRGRERREGVHHGTRLIGLKNLKARLQNRKAWSSTS